MPRKARVEFPGAVYHLLDRGDCREAIFRDDRDREIFLVTLGQVCARTGWRVHAWVLMTNHYHLLVETPEPNLVAGMRWFQTTHTVRFNRRLLQRALAYFGISIDNLNKLKRNDPRKLAIAQLIRSRTAVPNKWIAATLALGHVSGISRYCSEGEDGAKLARELGDRLGVEKG